MDRLYFDHNATTPVRPEVVQAMLPYFAEAFGNPASIHAHGAAARRAVENAREEVARLVGAEGQEILFTSGGTESDNLALLGAARARSDRGRHVITTRVEHHAVLEAAGALEREGFRVTRLPVDREGRVDPARLRHVLTPETVLVSIIWANNETGVVQDVSALAAIAREAGACFHTDAVQVPGKLPIDVRETGADLVSLSAHKFYGPKGVGALFVRRGVRLRPLQFGGGHEGGLRPGTLNVPGIVGMGEACRLVRRELGEMQAHLARLTARFEEGIRGIVPDAVIHGAGATRLPGTTCLSIPRVEGDALLISLDLEGIGVSSGSACSTGSLEASHVLTAMGIPKERAAGALRVSFGRPNTEVEVDRLLRSLEMLVPRMRALASGGGRKSRGDRV